MLPHKLYSTFEIGTIEFCLIVLHIVYTTIINTYVICTFISIVLLQYDEYCSILNLHRVELMSNKTFT